MSSQGPVLSALHRWKASQATIEHDALDALGQGAVSAADTGGNLIHIATQPQ
jgi:hypothetical protein